MTAGEHRKFCDWLQLDASSEVLEIASGSGGPALFMVHETGCSVIGLELHEAAVRAANDAAEQRGLVDRARFIGADAREPLPFEDASFDAVICIAANVVAVSAARRQARAAHEAELDELEGVQARADYDQYLRVVELLASEQRLTRLAYIAIKTP